MSEAASDTGFFFDDPSGLGDGRRRMRLEVGLQVGRVLLQGRGSPLVVPAGHGVEAAVAVLVEAALDTGPRESAQADDVGALQSVRGQPEDFHPLLNLRARVVEAVVVDPFEIGFRKFELSHGILPGGECRDAESTECGPARKAQVHTREA